MSGLEVSSFEICDFRNEWIADKIEEYDVIILSGGHVPTENKFFEKIKLKQKLQKFDGMVIAWSAGSMNCADVVYAVPEIDGEAIDKNYERFIPGLGITKKMIIPHFQAVSGETVDGLRVVEDMVYPDSMGKRIYSLN
jgi:dipeptidase E